MSVAGTPEAGGWTTRELKRIIRGLGGLNFVSVAIAPLGYMGLTFVSQLAVPTLLK